MKNKLIIIDFHQYGTLTDSYKWCEYLYKKYDITFICFDSGAPQKKEYNINVIYCKLYRNKLLRWICFYIRIISFILFHKGIVLIVYFQGCSLIKRLFRNRKMIVDIRTLSVNPIKNIRECWNLKLVKECKYFDRISVISEGIMKKIFLRNIFLLPLGADVITTEKHKYTDSIRLLYVGTLSGRNIEKTVVGLKLFIEEFPDVSVRYHIVGGGSSNELEELRTLVKDKEMDDVVQFHGYKPHEEVKYLYSECNIGVSFVPKTEFYEDQPPTKTYEYITSGLYTIATDTRCNKELISSQNGCVIEDTEIGFKEGCITFWENRESLNEDLIRTSLGDCSWATVVKKYLEPILEI